jgi:hypothetical protein
MGQGSINHGQQTPKLPMSASWIGGCLLAEELTMLLTLHKLQNGDREASRKKRNPMSW